jgi:hypothetical protein
MNKAFRSSKISVNVCHIKQHHIPENSNFHQGEGFPSTHRCYSSFYYLFTYLLHVSVIRPSSGRYIYIYIYIYIYVGNYTTYNGSIVVGY